MNYLDIVLLVPLLWGIYRGFTKGLIIEVASLVALGVGIWGGIHFSDWTGAQLTEHFNLQTEYLPLIAFAVTFVVLVVSVFLLAKMLEKVVNLVALKLVNKVGGAAFGAAKIGLILSVLLIIVDSVDREFHFLKDEDKNGSFLYNPVLGMAGTIIPGIKDSEVFDYVKTQSEELVDATIPEDSSLIPEEEPATEVVAAPEEAQ